MEVRILAPPRDPRALPARLLPAARVPGFAFHQTERNAPNGTLVMSPYRRRDFDLLGYRYSLLSTIGTAGLNNASARARARSRAYLSPPLARGWKAHLPPPFKSRGWCSL